MKPAILLPLFLLLYGVNVAFSQNQKTKSTINETESALLDIISKDTINPLQIKLDGEVFKFGLQVLTNSKISLLKKNLFYHLVQTSKLCNRLLQVVADLQRFLNWP